MAIVEGMGLMVGPGDLPGDVTRGGVDSGTTIIAVEYEGGVVLGADSRTSTGIYVANRVSDKITEIHDHICCCRSGSAADTQAVADMVRRYIKEYAVQHGRAPTVSVVSRLFRDVCYKNKDKLMAGIIIAGWDKVEGGQVYAIPLGGTLVRQPFSIGGSGSTFLYGLADREYRPGMTKEEALAFVRRLLAHAMARDGSSGGCIRTVVITEEGRERDFIPNDRLPFKLEEMSVAVGQSKPAAGAAPAGAAAAAGAGAGAGGV